MKQFSSKSRLGDTAESPLPYVGGESMKIKVILERGEDGYFVAHCPSLKSCWSQGKTREEALTNIQEAIALYLEPESAEFQETPNREIVELAL